MLSHWPCVTWKFFPIWLHKILKLIFQMQPSCHIIICIEHWRKLHILKTFWEIFLCLKNNDSVEHVQKVLLIVVFIYFQGKIKFSHCIWSNWLFWIFVYFYLILPFYFPKWNLFFSWWTKICKILHVILESTSQFSFKFCTNLHWNQT